MKNAHFYYKFPFCANLVISLGVFFSQVWLIIAKIGIFTTDMCWSVTGAHFASVLYDSKSRKLKLKKWRREKGRSETTICGPTTSENFSWSFALDYMFKNLYLIRYCFLSLPANVCHSKIQFLKRVNISSHYLQNSRGTCGL